MNKQEQLKELRDKIDYFDNELMKVLSKRLEVALEIHMLKMKIGVPVHDKERIESIINKISNRAAEHGLNASHAEEIWRKIIDMSIEHQLKSS